MATEIPPGGPSSDDVESFARSIGTGLHRVPYRDYPVDEALLARIKEFDAVRVRGATEAQSAYLHGPPRSTAVDEYVGALQRLLASNGEAGTGPSGALPTAFVQTW